MTAGRAWLLAALSGRFSPDALIARVAGEDPGAQDALARAICRDVAEVPGDGLAWTLLPGPRRAALQGLARRADIDRALAEALPPGDGFARALRALLRGDLAAPDPARHPDTADGLGTALREAGAMLEAAQFALAVPGLDRAAIEALIKSTKTVITDTQRRQDMLVLMPRDHVGYDAERRALSAFLRGVPDVGAPLPVFVSGIGGVGKSALMARLFHWWQRRSNAPLTIVLDFDRSQLKTGSPEEIFREFLRQAAVGIHHKGLPPDTAAQVAAGLNGLRRDLVGASGTGTAADHQTQLGYLVSTLPGSFADSWAAPLRRLPIAVIFDSFEALDRRGGTNVDTVLGTEAALRAENVLPNIRSVFSGREDPLDPEAMRAAFGPASRSIRLRGLAPEDGAALLRQADLAEAGKRPGGAPLLGDAATRHDISDALDGHPLTLLLAVRFIHSRPEALDELVGDLRNRSDFQAELAQTFLYDRVLDRIQSPEVRGLAHPGLVLRHVDADLIRYVLAGPCLGLDAPPPPAEGDRLRAALSGEYWLVETAAGPGDALRHRPDLRSKMLPVLFAGPRSDDGHAASHRKTGLRDKALAVCAGAQSYYRDGPPASDAPARARWASLPQSFRDAHHAYYAAFAAPGDASSVTAPLAALLQAELGDDEIDNMPTRWRARIRALNDAQLSGDELESLEGDLYETAQSGIFQAETKAGRKRKAPPAAGVDSGRMSSAAMERQIASSFAEADLAAVLARAPDYLAALSQDDTAAQRLRDAARTALWQTPAWQIILSAAALGPDAALPALSGPDRGPDHWTGLGMDVGTWSTRAATGGQLDLAQLGALVADAEDMTLDGYRLQASERWRPRIRPARSRGAGHDPLVSRLANLALAVSGYPEQMYGPLRAHAPDIAKALDALWDRSGSADASDAVPVGLRDINSLYAQGNRQWFELDAGALSQAGDNPFLCRLFRGVTPELYDPLQVTLPGIAPSLLAQAVEQVAQAARFWPSDLDPAQGAALRSTPPRVIAETVDRVGLMRPFLAQLSGPPGSPCAPLLRIHDAITGWFFPAFRNGL